MKLNWCIRKHITDENEEMLIPLENKGDKKEESSENDVYDYYEGFHEDWKQINDKEDQDN